MASLNSSLLHGFINSTHTSNITSFYPPQNLPTPWPLVIASLVLSLGLSCYRTKGAFLSWTEEGQDRRRALTSGVRQTWLQTFRERRAKHQAGTGRAGKGKKRAPLEVHESELEDLHKPDLAHPHHGLIDETFQGYDNGHPADLEQKLNGDNNDSIDYTTHAEDDNRSKQKHHLEDEDIMYKGKGIDDDDMGSKYTHMNPFGNSEAATLHESIREVPKSPKWDATPQKRSIMIIICVYCCFRAVIGLIIAVAGLINHHTPPPAPSLLLLCLVSIQIFVSDRSLPRLMTLLYTISAVLASAAFLVSAYAPLSTSYNSGNALYAPYTSTLPAYGYLSLTGGRCPVPASDCHSQAAHWSVLGCAKYTYYLDMEDDDDDEIPHTQFYPPYATHSDVNLNANALHIVETVIFIFGTAWLLTVLLHAYEGRKLFVGGPAVGSNLLRPQGPMPPYPGERRKKGKRKGQCGALCTSIVTILGVIGVFVAAVMSLAAHMSQATGTPGHSTTYIDSLGPGTWANFTRDRKGVVNSTRYWGNATDWNDCFTVVSPTIGTGWGDWAAQNGGWEWIRVVAGL